MSQTCSGDTFKEGVDGTGKLLSLKLQSSAESYVGVPAVVYWYGTMQREFSNCPLSAISNVKVHVNRHDHTQLSKRMGIVPHIYGEPTSVMLAGGAGLAMRCMSS